MTSRASPLSRPLDVVLHIGMRKTGTSTVQHFLRENRDRLAEAGYLYPDAAGHARHRELGLFIKSPDELEKSIEWYRQKHTDPVRFRKAFRRQLFQEIESSGASRVVLSDEILFECTFRALGRLGQFSHRIADNLTVVVYLRRQDDHLISGYQQEVKVGGVKRLQDWARADWSGLYDYAARLHAHTRLLAPTDLVVRRFEPDFFVDGSLYQDFLQAAGIDVRAVELQQTTNRNPSLDADSVEFLRLLNLYKVENDGATPGLIDNRSLSRKLSAASTGPTLTLSPAFLDEFMAQWEEPNRRVARQFLGDSSGQLFHAPRKTHNTTTEQRLDVDRLDRFFTLLDIPEQLHAPLRGLAEHETKA